MLVSPLTVEAGIKLTSSDLLLIKSKLYNLEHGVLTMDKSREFGGTPVVKLGDNFKKVAVSTRSIPYFKQRVVEHRLIGRTLKNDSSRSQTSTNLIT